MENKEKKNGIGKMLSKILLYPLQDKRLAVLMVLTYLALILPIIYVGKWNAPQLDDFGYTVKTHAAWQETHNVFAVLKAAVAQAQDSYRTWQGTFSSIFLMALSPHIYNYRGYKLVPAMIIAGMTPACLMLARTLLKDCLHKKNMEWISLGAIASILTIEKIYTIPSGLTWYNAAVHYMFMHSVMILLLCSIVRLVQVKIMWKKIVYLILSVLFAVGTGGTNYATSVMGILLAAATCGILFLYEKRRAFISLIPLAVTLLCFLLNITAPGNAIRADNYVGWGKPALQSILLSFGSAASYSVKWMDVFTALVLVMLIPVFWHIFGKENGESGFRFPLPGLVLLYSFCILASGFTSSWYSLGHSGLSRLLNVVRMSYQLLLIINEGYFIGWLRRVLGEKGRKDFTLHLSGFLILAILMWGSVHFHHNPLGTFTTFSAYYYIRVPQAAWYYNEYMERREILETSAGQNVLLIPYQNKPWLFFIEDITEDPDDWRNSGVSRYYSLSSVRLMTEEELERTE